jgi:hypothetical protein
MKEFVVDLSDAKSWADFIAAFHRDFILPGCGTGCDWNGNLDAFNDYLWWPEPHPFRLVLRGWASCMTTVNQHHAPDGRPVLEVVDELLRDNAHVIVIRD